MDTRTAILPVGTLAMPGDTVRQIVRAPIVGVVSKDVPLQVDQKSGRVQFQVDWVETAADGTEHVASTWFEAHDVEILDRPPEPEPEEPAGE